MTRDLRGLVKVNPIATWSDLDVQGYIADHDVPVNPLLHQGYARSAASRARHCPPTPATPLGPLGRPGQDGVRGIHQ